AENTRERRAHAGFAGLAERGDRPLLQVRTRVAAEQFRHRGQRVGSGDAQAEEARRCGEARVIGASVEFGEKFARLLFDLGLERAGLVPLRGEWKRAAAGAAGEQFAERSGKFWRHCRRVLERFAERVEDAALERVRSA